MLLFDDSIFFDDPVTGNNSNKWLCIWALNIQGVSQAKFDVILEELLEDKVDVLCCSETWCTIESAASYDLQGYRLVSSFCRSSTTRGGVGVWVSDRVFSDSQCIDLSSICCEKLFEICGVKLCNYIILTCYRSPGPGFSDYLNKLESVLNQYWSLKNKFVIVGDFNVDLLQ